MTTIAFAMPQSNDTSPAATEPVHQPHAPLTEYYRSEQERAGFLRGIFDSTAADYDRVERMLAFGTGPGYRGKALERAGLKRGMQVLDVGFGTGLVSAQAIRIVGDPALVTGVDPSPAMMQASPLLNQVRLLEGKAEKLPVPDASVDFVSMGYALRHVSDVEAAFSEFHRVLRPGGRVCILEITKPESALGTALLKGYMRGWVPTLAWLSRAQAHTPRMWRYYWDSIEACAPPAQILATLQSCGFASAQRHVELGIFSEYQAVTAG